MLSLQQHHACIKCIIHVSIASVASNAYYMRFRLSIALPLALAPAPALSSIFCTLSFLYLFPYIFQSCFSNVDTCILACVCLCMRLYLLVFLTIFSSLEYNFVGYFVLFIHFAYHSYCVDMNRARYYIE